MMSIVLMLLLLVGSFVLFGGLVHFCESIIGPAPAINRQASTTTDGPQGGKVVKHFLSGSSG